MAISVVQSAKSNNGLAQTFNTVFSSAPTEGNLLIAALRHDETSADIADLTSSGWTRMQTVLFSAFSPDYRLSVWAKFAGAGESSTIAWDIGEVNRRSHGWGVEISGAAFSTLPTEDTADEVNGDETVASGSNQVDNSIDVPEDLLAFCIVGMIGTITGGTVSWDSGVTTIDDYSANFNGSGVGVIEGPVTVQPTVTWTGNRQSFHALIIVGEPPPPVPESAVLRGSSFQVRPASS